MLYVRYGIFNYLQEFVAVPLERAVSHLVVDMHADGSNVS